MQLSQGLFTLSRCTCHHFLLKLNYLCTPIGQVTIFAKFNCPGPNGLFACCSLVNSWPCDFHERRTPNLILPKVDACFGVIKLPTVLNCRQAFFEKIDLGILCSIHYYSRSWLIIPMGLNYRLWAFNASFCDCRVHCMCIICLHVSKLAVARACAPWLVFMWSMILST